MPAKKIDENKYAPTTWNNDAEDLACPSGQLCLVKRPDIKKLIENGTLDKVDMLTSMVDQKHVSKKAKGGKNSAKSQDMANDIAIKKIVSDPKKFAELIETVDKVVMATVIQPELHEVPKNDDGTDDDDARLSGTVYIDNVDLNDKMFILQFAFAGTRDVARFRAELTESIDRLANVETMAETAE